MLACSTCGHANRPGRRFCAQCGDAIGEVPRHACPACGAANAEADKFCGACGAALPAVGDRQGERRQLTLLFCDVVGSTELSARLDPEEWRDVLAAYQRAVSEAVGRFDGRVANFIGDGVVAHFGYPRAHDDDAERACHAGLAILESLAALNARGEGSTGVSLQVRIGIHTGPVVVGATADAEIDVFGDAPIVAARVQTAAAPDSVYITESTHRIVADLFDVAARGSHALKGIATPLPLYEVLRPHARWSRLHAGRGRALTQFVGRERERRVLLERYEAARAGAGQVVLITGKPGIGKSRLAQTLRESTEGDARWVVCEGSPYQQHTPFFPVTDMMRQLIAVHDEAPSAERALRLERMLARDGLDVREALPLLAPLLGLSVPAGYAPLLLSPDGVRARLLATLVDWVLATATAQPLVVLLEDLQWVDASTLELQRMLLAGVATGPLLLLYTARDDATLPWPLPPTATNIELTRLGGRETRELVRNVLTRVPLTRDVTDAIVARSDGVPLFVEELTRFVAHDTAASRAIPDTLQDPLMARLDQLGPAKEVAQLGAVIGRSFSYALLHAVAGFDEAALDGALDRLREAELVGVRGTKPGATYTFHHVLMQERAYDSLLKSRRRELHAAIARVLATEFADTVAMHPEVVARHYTEAGDAAPAIAAWQRAGELAAGRSAHSEAVGHFEHALAALATLPEDTSRDAQELILQIERGHSLGTRSYADPRVGEAFARARALSARLQNSTQLFFPLLGMWGAAVNRGEVRAAGELAAQLVEIARGTGSAIEMVWGHFAAGVTRYYEGELSSALDHLERAIALPVSESHPMSLFDPAVAARSYVARATWVLGLADTARTHAHQAVADAEAHGNAYDRAWAHAFACVVECSCREADAVFVHADAVLTPAIEQQFAQFYAIALILRGWATAHRGDVAEGIACVRRGLTRHLATGQRIAYRFFLGLLAEMYADSGAVDDGMRFVDDGLASSSGDEIFRPELLRIRGKLLALAGGDGEAVIASYREAIDMAHRQRATIHELRARVELCRFVGGGGAGVATRRELAALLATITEGAELADIRDARRVLGDAGIVAAPVRSAT